MTPEQEEIRDVAAFAIASLPIGQRVAFFLALGELYFDLCRKSFPDRTEQQLIASAKLYSASIVERVWEIDQASGGAPAGNA